ncbi:hypothetical protein [Dinoroseobacter sp. S76]|uniref:hypothetical protein n=1 Tax=Dinoroseobacter sp. S76 TaxID=3415124 RepID=UPI003C7B92B9
MRAFLVLILTLTLATPLSAQTLCRFETECFEGEACAPSSFEMRLSLPETQATVTSRLVAETDAGSFPGYALRGGPERRQFFFDAESAGYMLTLNGAEARLAVHIDEGPLMVNYIGTCEAE